MSDATVASFAKADFLEEVLRVGWHRWPRAAADVEAAPPSLVLGIIFLVIGIAWMTRIRLSVSRLRDRLMSARVRQWLARATGVALLRFSAS